MGSFIIVLTVFAVYCSEVYCDTLPTEVTKPEDPALLEKSNNSHATIERESFWKNLGLSKRRTARLEASRYLEGANSAADVRKGRFLNSLAFLTGLSFGGLATAASSTMKSIAKMPQMFSINLGSSKTSPYFAAYYSQYPYAPLLPYPFFYPGPFGITPVIDAAKPQTSQNDLAPQVINLFEHRPIDLAGNNEDYDTDEEKSNGGNRADDRVRAEADRNAEEKGTTRGCKEGHRKSSKGAARDREYLQQTSDVDLRAAMNFRAGNQSILGNIIDSILGGGNTTITTPPNNDTNTTQLPQHHHHHHHHHHGDYTDYPPFQGYYGGYPQNVHHVDLTTTQPYTQLSYNVPYEQPNYYHDDKYNAHPGLSPSYSPSISPGRNEYQATDFNRLYSEFQPPSNNDGFKPLK